MKEFSLKYSPWILWAMIPLLALYVALTFDPNVCYYIPPFLIVGVVGIPVFVLGAFLFFFKKYIAANIPFFTIILWLTLLLFLFTDVGDELSSYLYLSALVSTVLTMVLTIFNVNGNRK